MVEEIFWTTENHMENSQSNSLEASSGEYWSLLIKCCCLLHNLMVDHREKVFDIDPVLPHSTSYGLILCLTQEFYEGGPEAKD